MDRSWRSTENRSVHCAAGAEDAVAGNQTLGNTAGI